SLDPTFGAGGLVWTNISIQPGGADKFNEVTKDRAHALLLQPDGRLVAGGFASCCNSGGTEDFALTRYNPDGSLDPSFGGDGIVRTDFLGIFTDDEIYGMALQPDGKIVAVGRAETNDRLGTYDYAVARYNATSGAPATPTPTPLTTPTPAATPTPGGGSAGGLQYYPLPSPVRLFDTRPGQPACSNKGSAMAAGSTYAVAARVACAGLPAAAVSVVGHVTVINNLQGAGPGFVTLFPGGSQRPTVSNINYASGQVLSNAFGVGLGADGSFSIYAHSTTDLLIDVVGYYAPPGAGGLYFHPLPRPVRLLDTRIGQAACDAPGAPVPAGGARAQLARTACDGLVIPDDALALAGNAAVVNDEAGASAGFLTFYPSGAQRPVVSNMTYAAGQVISSAFTTTLGADGRFQIYAHSTVNVIVDVTGYYSASALPDANGSAGLLYRALPAPFRLLDTRAGEPACHNPAAPLSGGTAFKQQAEGTCGATSVPAGAEAVTGNATVVNTAAGAGFGYVTLYPSEAERPLVSNINYVPGQALSNSFTVRLGADGAFSIYVLSTTHYITDLTGYFVPTPPN
ncbi:MAG TPA: delta-60 repeat domain-containing protein, partial [Pyrinomonadaceae bacterium]|nr:delta-60 repeat domain-containing protein [Pyrinomonadaceae bacterium]